MSAVRVKICGVTEPEQALAAAEEGAAFIGLMFYPQSHRLVSVEQARSIVEAVRAAYTGDARPQMVGVFVNERSGRINVIADAVGLDQVQLSGDEPWDLLAETSVPAIKAVRVPAGADPDAVLNDLAFGLHMLETTQSLCLLDAAVEGKYGGTGQRVDVEVARRLAERTPLLLAGGLTPDNVAEAIAAVRPWGVDVSGGVETNKVKDIAKIRAFIRNALAALPN